MAGMTRMVSGVVLILLGAWGALVPFVGPYFHYAYTPDKAWAYNSGRLWLSVLPGAAAVLGGAWFAVGGILGPTWSGTWMNPGTPVGGTGMRAVEQLGFFTGLGIVIVLVAAMALGRCLVAAVQPAVPDGEAEVEASRDPADTSRDDVTAANSTGAPKPGSTA